MSNLGIAIESVVAALLAVTIVYCFLLNKRLTRLKTDEEGLKGTIAELIAATDAAQRAIGGLKLTVQECDQGLGERLKAAELVAADIGRHMAASEQVLAKLAQIAKLARPLADEAAGDPDPSPTSAQATLAVAQAFAARARLRKQGAAA